MREQNVDIMCLQECKIDKLPKRLGGLSLAGAVIGAALLNSDTGLAVYINPTIWAVEDKRTYSLPSMLYEKLLQKKDRPRLQLFRFSHMENQKNQLILGNTHIACLLAGNRGRRIQAVRAAKFTLEFAADTPSILTGDFNYPFAETRMVQAVEQTGLSYVKGATTTPTYNRWPKRTFDRMFTRGLKTDSFAVLPFGNSDHAPIVGKFQISL